MMWTLVLLTAMIPHSSQGGGGIDSLSVQGFAAKADCITAGQMIGLPRDGDRWSKIYSTFTCVPMGEKK